MMSRSLAGGRLGGGDVVLALGGGDDERVDAGLGDRRRLLAQPADRPDRAVERHRAGHGDATGRRQLAVA